MDMAAAMAIRCGAQRLEQLFVRNTGMYAATALAGLPSLSNLHICRLAKSGGDGGLAAWAALPLGQLTNLVIPELPAAADLGALTQLQVLVASARVPLRLPATASVGTLSQLRELSGVELPFDRVQLLADSLPLLQVLFAHFVGEWGLTHAAFSRVTRASLVSNTRKRLPASGIVRLAQLLPVVERMGLADFGDAGFVYDLTWVICVEALSLNLSNATRFQPLATMCRLSRLRCYLDYIDPPGFPAGFPDFSRLTALEGLDLELKGCNDAAQVDLGPYLCGAARAPALHSLCLTGHEEVGAIGFGTIVRLARDAAALRRLALVNIAVDAQQFAALGTLRHLQCLQVDEELVPDGDRAAVQRLAAEIEAAGGPVVVLKSLDGMVVPRLSILG